MAKKKNTRRKKQTLKSNIKVELVGLLFIFLAIFGSGASMISEGAVSSLLENIFRFFFGSWYFIVPVLLLFLGVFLMIKRKYPVMKTRKWIGIYLVLSGLLLWTHIRTFELAYIFPEQYPSIIGQSYSFYIEYLQGAKSSAYLGGGGLYAALLFAVSNFLFSNYGAKILAFFFVVIGIVVLSNLSMGDLFSTLFS